MKKLRLKKWVKVVSTIMLIIISVLVYKGMGNLNLVNTIFVQPLAILGWSWLFIGQFGVLSMIWE